MTTIANFINWFDGFTSFMGDKPPNKEQWAKVRERISALGDVDDVVAKPAVVSQREAATQKANEDESLTQYPGVPTETGLPLAKLWLTDEKSATKQWREQFAEHLRLIDSTVDGPSAREFAEMANVEFDVCPKAAAELERQSWRT